MAKKNTPKTFREAAAEMTATIDEFRRDIEAQNARTEAAIETASAYFEKVFGAVPPEALKWFETTRRCGDGMLKFTRHRLWEIFAEIANRELTDDQFRALFKLH